MPDPIKSLRAIAMMQGDVEEGIACPGTAMERRTIKANKKAFLFFGATDAMVKLDASLAEARRLAKAEPARYRVGANGWVKATFSTDEPPALDVFKKWIAESYALVGAPKKTKKKR